MFEERILEELITKTIGEKTTYEAIDRILDEILMPEIAKHVYDIFKNTSTQIPSNIEK